MMKPKVLQLVGFTPATEEQLALSFDVVPLWKQSDPDAFIAVHGANFSAIATNGLVGADGALIKSLPSLRLIASRGVGVDGIDLEAARAYGVAVSNTPEVLTNCVADAAFGALISVARNFCAADRFVRQGSWMNGRFPLSTRVSGKRLGIVGLGRIGRAVAARSAGFDMEVRYHNTKPALDAPYPFEASLVELAHWADFLVVTVVGGGKTQHLIDAEVIAALGKKGFLINVSRGTVVDESALVNALLNQQLAGAALDVFENEPEVPKELFDLQNVMLLPHISSSTKETFTAMEDLVLANMRQFFSDGSLLTPV